MSRSRLLGVLWLAALISMISVAPARAQADLRLRIDAIDQSDYPRVALQVSLLDSTNHLIVDNVGTRFTVREDNTVREALVSPDTRPLDLVLALDLSCAVSMSIDQLRAIVRTFLDQQRDGDRVAVLLIGEVPWVATTFTTDRSTIEAVLNSINTDWLGPHIALYNGVYEAVRLASQGPTGRSAVVVITNGVNRPSDQTSSLSFGDLTTFAAAQQVPITTLAIGNQPRRPDLASISSDAAMIDSAESEAVLRAAEQLAVGLRRGYRVSFTLDTPAGTLTPALDLEAFVPGYGTLSAPIPLAPIPTPTSTPSPTVTATAGDIALATLVVEPTVTPTASSVQGSLWPLATGLGGLGLVIFCLIVLVSVSVLIPLLFIGMNRRR